MANEMSTEMIGSMFISADSDQKDDQGQVQQPVPMRDVEFMWYLSLKDPSHQVAFDDYRLKDAFIFTKWILFASITLGAIVRMGFAITQRDSLMLIISPFEMLYPACYGYYIYYVRLKSVNVEDSHSLVPLRYVANIFMLLQTVVRGISMARQSAYGPCPESDRTTILTYCNPSTTGLPSFTLFVLATGNFLWPIVLRCHSPFFPFMNTALMYLFILVSIFLSDLSPDRIFMFFGLGITSFIAFYDYEYSIAASFTSFVNMENAIRQKSMAENEKKVIAENAKDLRHFIGNVAHDLKTPLQAFITELDCLEKSVTTKEGQTSLQSLKSTCHYMTMTINRSLDYVKSTSGFKLLPKAETVNIATCFEWVRSCIKQYAGKNMHIVIDPILPSICQHIITDKQWLLENLLCLASNSVKYIGETGNVHFRVSLETAENTLSSDEFNTTTSVPMLLFEVEDDGVGIPEEKMVELFRPFKQAQRNAGGTGLGLFALSKRAVAIGGKYGVRRRRDQESGVLFWFTIPYRPDTSIDTADERIPEVVISSIEEIEKEDQSMPPDISSTVAFPEIVSRTGGINILLVEDSKLIQKATARLLQKHGHFVDIANNGVECLQRIREKQYDMLLMDINMPVMDGLQTIQRIRADELETGKRRFVIGISADSDTETRNAALQYGMNDFIEKPLDVLTLKKKCLSHNIML